MEAYVKYFHRNPNHITGIPNKRVQKNGEALEFLVGLGFWSGEWSAQRTTSQSFKQWEENFAQHWATFVRFWDWLGLNSRSLRVPTFNLWYQRFHCTNEMPEYKINSFMHSLENKNHHYCLSEKKWQSGLSLCCEARGGSTLLKFLNNNLALICIHFCWLNFFSVHRRFF